MGTTFYVSDFIMSFHTNRFHDRELDRLYKILREGLEENTELDEKRKLVNSILPKQKYKLLQRFVSYEEDLSQALCLKYLPIFLDENTKFLGFKPGIYRQEIVKSIFELLPRYCPKIEIVDFRAILIKPENKENFKIFLKQTTQLKSLRVQCYFHNDCAIRQLLLEEDFNLHDQDVKSGLLKIEHIHGIYLTTSDCVRLLKLLPNLKSLGRIQNLSVLLPIISDNEDIPKTLAKITEFSDKYTSLATLQCFSNFCPKAKHIFLTKPQKNVIENLRKFSLLTELVLDSEDPDFVSEVINLLNIIGKQIKILSLCCPAGIELDPNIFHNLCPNLVKLVINLNQYYFE